MNYYDQLQGLFNELTHLERLEALAHWDEATMMPVGGGAARAESISTLCAIKHSKLTDRAVGDLINKAREQDNLDPWQQRNLELIERQYQNATCLPVKLVKAIAEKGTLCEQAWRNAREHNDWNSLEPKLSDLFQLIQESASIRAAIFQKVPYDVLLDDFSPGVSQATIDPIFNELKAKLPPLVDQIIEHQSQHQITPLADTFPIDKQRELSLTVMRHIGFNFNHGRLDTSHHPFCGGFSDDVRVTTRYDEKDFLSSLLAVCHETGHACYEQGLPCEWSLQPIGKALGMSVHESQSLIVEMPACRSREFMQYLTPHAIKSFGKQAALTADNLFHICTKVEKSLIRVEADEVTYPLHVILRYELERGLFNGDLTIKELPDAWHDKMQTYLGLATQGNDKDGVMQDVHWPSAAFGYFPAYTLGRLIASQLYATALKAHPEIPQKISDGDFHPLMHWLNEHVHSKGSSLTMDSLIEQATGESLSADFYLTHIKQLYLV